MDIIKLIITIFKITLIKYTLLVKILMSCYKKYLRFYISAAVTTFKFEFVFIINSVIWRIFWIIHYSWTFNMLNTVISRYEIETSSIVPYLHFSTKRMSKLKVLLEIELQKYVNHLIGLSYLIVKFTDFIPCMLICLIWLLW